MEGAARQLAAIAQITGYVFSIRDAMALSNFVCRFFCGNKWGLKQRRVYELDEDGNRIRDQNGEYVFNAVPTTDWGSPETLEHWRQTWAELCNAKFAEKGLDVRIDHRSYERQGVELLPTVHEGATVRAMEKKGIRTEKGEFNRWIRATNAVIRDIKKKIALLFDWIAVLDGAS